MKATVLYRIAAVVFVLFAAGHTFGFLSFKPPTPEGLAVRDAMNQVYFKVGNASFSYGHFYMGFGLSATVSMLFSAFVAWYLGGMARSNPHAIQSLAWVFVAVQVVGVVLSYLYFSVAPAAFSAVLVIVLGWAAWLVTAS
ncbi:MAG: hypothetical protein WB421_09675 [Terriglobales bacterium]